MNYKLLIIPVGYYLGGFINLSSFIFDKHPKVADLIMGVILVLLALGMFMVVRHPKVKW